MNELVVIIMRRIASEANLPWIGKRPHSIAIICSFFWMERVDEGELELNSWSLLLPLSRRPSDYPAQLLTNVYCAV